MREALIPGGCWGCIALPSPVMYLSIEQAEMLRQRADVDHVKEEIARLSDACRYGISGGGGGGGSNYATANTRDTGGLAKTYMLFVRHATCFLSRLRRPCSGARRPRGQSSPSTRRYVYVYYTNPPVCSTSSLTHSLTTQMLRALLEYAQRLNSPEPLSRASTPTPPSTSGRDTKKRPTTSKSVLYF